MTLAFPTFEAATAAGRAPRPYQIATIEVQRREPTWLCTSDMGLGKGHPVGTKILTLGGWRPIESLVAGDAVVGSGGRSVVVTGVFDRGELDVFTVRMTDGSVVRCDGDHLWSVRSGNDVARGGEARVFSTRELASMALRDNQTKGRPRPGWRWRIPVVAPVEFPEASLPVDPYVLGVLLGDGSLSRTLLFTKNDSDLPGLVQKRLPEGVHITSKRGRACVWHHCIAGRHTGKRDSNPVVAGLVALGLLGVKSLEKFIPEQYLLASIEQRRSLLRGLLDTDGTFFEKKLPVYVTSSPKLADGVTSLVESLGGTVAHTVAAAWFTRDVGGKRRRFEAAPSHRLSISLPVGGAAPVSLARKLAVWKAAQATRKYPPVRKICAVEPAGRELVFCISVSAPDQLYVTERFIVTHNTTTALLSMPLGMGVMAICPASVRGLEKELGKPIGGWLAEAARVRPDLKRTRVQGNGKLRWPEPGELVVASYETMRTTVAMEPLSRAVACVFDEAQAVKSSKSLQSKAAARLVAQVLAAGGKALSMTGTPLMRDPEDLKTILKVMKLFDRAFDSDVTFGRCFNRGLRTQAFGVPRCKECGKPVAEAYATMFGRSECHGAELKKPKKVTSWSYGKPTPEAVARLKRVSLGFLLEEVTDLPPVVEVEHAVDLHQEGLRALAELGKLTDEELLAAIEREQVASDPDSHVAKARAALSAAKHAVVGDVLDEITDAGERVVFFADHRTPIEEAVDKRPRWGAVIGGRAWVHGEGDMPREAVIDRFARGELDGFCATLGAGGTGVDGLQRAARHLVLLEESWSPSLVKQAIGRLRRLGQMGTVVLHKLTTGHPVEERVHSVVEKKMQYLEAIDDARRHGPAQVMLGGWDLSDPEPNPGSWIL